ncbi:MAG TPA: ChaN family lipoprotein, partial [Vicinamibacterales bacterium]
CPTAGDYYDRFLDAMTDHGAAKDAAPSADTGAKTDRYYLAQCVKDETMAESIAGAVRQATERPRTVVHYNGSFHSDFGEGTAEKAARRLTGRRIVVVTIIPVDDLDVARPDGDDLKRADYLVYTVK